MRILKERIREIASTALHALIELDFHNGIRDYDCETIEDYCKKMLNASREEVEEIIGMDMEDIRTVKECLRDMNK